MKGSNMNNKSIKNIINYGIILCFIFLIVFCIFNFKNQKKVRKMDQSLINFVGNWEANGTQFKLQIGTNADGSPKYDDDYSKPYQLSLKKDGSYYINFNNKNGKEVGLFYKENKNIVFEPDNIKKNKWKCEIKDETEIINCIYASSFTKIN